MECSLTEVLSRGITHTQKGFLYQPFIITDSLVKV